MSSRRTRDERIEVRTPIELAWCAGMFDGEGSTSLYGVIRQSGTGIRNSMRMAFSQSHTGPQIPDRFRISTGLGTVRQRVSRPQNWTWTLTGSKCLLALELLWPYLRQPKKIQALKVLSALQENRLSLPAGYAKKGALTWEHNLSLD